MRKFLLPGGIVLLAAAGIFLAYHYIFQPAPSQVEGEKAVISLEASALLSAFDKNEASANAEYLDKVIAITGVIGEIHQDEQYTTLTLKKPGAYSGIICTFENTSLNDPDFQIGEEVKVKGLCTGYLIDVVLIKCSLAD